MNNILKLIILTMAILSVIIANALGIAPELILRFGLMGATTTALAVVF